MKKRILSFVLALVMAVSLLPLNAFASEDEQNSGRSSVDVTDFSFYAVRTWQADGYYNQRSESQIQLTEKDGEYILYVPVNGINDLGTHWDLRVQAPQAYSSTFSLYYIRFTDSLSSGFPGLSPLHLWFTDV